MQGQSLSPVSDTRAGDALHGTHLGHDEERFGAGRAVEAAPPAAPHPPLADPATGADSAPTIVVPAWGTFGRAAAVTWAWKRDVVGTLCMFVAVGCAYYVIRGARKSGNSKAYWRAAVPYFLVGVFLAVVLILLFP